HVRWLIHRCGGAPRRRPMLVLAAGADKFHTASAVRPVGLRGGIATGGRCWRGITRDGRFGFVLDWAQEKDGNQCASKSNTAASETMNRAPVRRRSSSKRPDQMRR